MIVPSRLQGLDDATAQNVVAAANALAIGRVDQAAAQLHSAIDCHRDHPEVLRLHAGILSLRGDHANAVKAMQHALDLRPSDALYHNTLGTVLGASGDFDGAIRALLEACELRPDLAIAWYNLGIMLTRAVRYEDATEALKRAVELAPDNMDARAQLADMLGSQGRVEESTTQYRKVLSNRPTTGSAWWGLANLRVGALTPADIDRMRAALRNDATTDVDRVAIGFALAKALDETGSYTESLDALKQANVIARLRGRWNATKFSALINAISQAFTPPSASATDPHLGHEALFIVGMPRSGTTLVEQILASHSEVEGTGELHDLPQVLTEESRRRGEPFPHWVAAMRAGDWQRLGERYLERTASWRKKRPKFTDKLPDNWTSLGTIRAMLPGAHIVVCRRDPLETCFSCYRQHFLGNEYSRTFEDLAAFWRNFNRTANHFAALHPAHVYQHDYEALIASPEQEIRNLLVACNLPFQEQCLRFYNTKRNVLSPSATQVRRPLQADTRRARLYGSLLNPLRLSLGLPTIDR